MKRMTGGMAGLAKRVYPTRRTLLFTITALIGFTLIPAVYAGLFGPSEKEYCASAILKAIEVNNLSAKLTEEGLSDSEKKRTDEKMRALIRSSIEDGKKVSDKFLDGIHPKLREQFRQNLMHGMAKYLEGWEKPDVSAQSYGVLLMEAWWKFKDANRDLLFDKILKR